MNKKIGVVTALMACVGIVSVSFAYQDKTGDEPKSLPPAIPTAKPNPTNPDTKKASHLQSSARRSAQIDPEAYARLQKAVKPSDDSLRRSQILYGSGDLAGAERAAQETIKLSAGLSPGAQAISRRLIGQIRMQQGRYKEALDWMQGDRQEGMDARLDLDIALCYTRLGNYRTARQFYSDEAILRYNSSITERDLPGTRTSQMLEASILLACGTDSYMRGLHEEAFKNLAAALKLAPKNGLAAYYAAMSLAALGRRDEAGPYFVLAMQNGHGRYAQTAERWASAYLHNEAVKQQKSLDQNTAQSKP